VSGDAIWQIGLSTVYRTYRIKAFADDTLNIPNGSGTLGSINEVLPLEGKLLSSEDPLQVTYKPFRVFGAHWRIVREKGQPDVPEVTAKDFELSHYRIHFDPSAGTITFDDPVFSVESGLFVPAELYLECSFGLTNTTTNAPTVYHKDTSFDTGGYGYYTVRVPDQFAQVVVAYDADQIVTGSTNNQSTLDSIAALEAAALVASMSSSFSEVKVYSQPQLSVRLDGAITQVQHISTHGELRHAVNRTTASRFGEFDRNIPSRKQRAAYLQSLLTAAQSRWQVNQLRKRDPSDG